MLIVWTNCISFPKVQQVLKLQGYDNDEFMLAMNNVVKAWMPCIVSNTLELGFKVIRGMHACKLNDFVITHKCITKVQKQDSEQEWEYELFSLKTWKIPSLNVRGFHIVTCV